MLLIILWFLVRVQVGPPLSNPLLEIAGVLSLERASNLVDMLQLNSTSKVP